MTALKIYYFGLICHVGRKPNRPVKRFAVAPKDTSHPHHFALFHNAEPRPVRIPLTGNVTFSLPKGDARAEPQFMHHVPSLATILRGELRTDVEDGDADDVFYIDYPAGGVLDVADLYKCRARHRGNGQERRHDSVARLTYLSVETTPGQNVDIFSGGSRVATVGPDECILIAYSCNRHGTRRPCGDNPSHGDFREFEKLLIDPDRGDAEETEGAGTDVPFPHRECLWIPGIIDNEHADVSTHIECGNTDYP